MGFKFKANFISNHIQSINAASTTKQRKSQYVKAMLSVFFNTTFNAFMKGMKYTLNVSSSYHRLRHEVELVLIVPIDSHPVIKCKNVFS